VHLCGCVRDQLGSFATAYTLVSSAGGGARRCVLGPVGWAWHAIRRAGRVGCIGVGLGQLTERPYIYLLLVCFIKLVWSVLVEFKTNYGSI
jgi:hypothetical protein